MPDNAGKIDHPTHYQAINDPAGVYECIKVVEAWGLNFHLGCVLKYVCRAGRKQGATQEADLEKALWYLARELARHRHALTGRSGPVPEVQPATKQ